jgi:hypothetical protein
MEVGRFLQTTRNNQSSKGETKMSIKELFIKWLTDEPSLIEYIALVLICIALLLETRK